MAKKMQEASDESYNQLVETMAYLNKYSADIMKKV